jgi:phosphoribosylanthranilate isomerase
VTRVKVCGLTQAEDVRLAVALGAWACGFILTESPRRVSPSRAQELTAAAAGALAVGVVTTEPAERVAAMVASAGCDAVQLSAGVDGPSVKAVRAAAAGRGLRPLVIAAADTPGAADADLVLLDARSPGRYGGTGRTLDWRALARSFEGGPQGLGSTTAAAGLEASQATGQATKATVEPSRLVLAGGLTPGNVVEAVTALWPFAVDVASGIERKPGCKDEGLMTRFFAAVVAADTAGDAASARDPLPEVAP